MKKIVILLLLLSLLISLPSCCMLNNPSGKASEYQVTTIKSKLGESFGPNVELQGEYPVFEYKGKNAEYARYCEDLNDILSREAESWTELANEILEAAQTLCIESKELTTFSFEINILCEVSNENGYPAVTFFVCEVRGPGSGGECNYQIKYHTDDGTMIYRTLTETTRVY